MLLLSNLPPVLKVSALCMLLPLTWLRFLISGEGLVGDIVTSVLIRSHVTHIVLIHITFTLICSFFAIHRVLSLTIEVARRWVIVRIIGIVDVRKGTVGSLRTRLMLTVTVRNRVGSTIIVWM